MCGVVWYNVGAVIFFALTDILIKKSANNLYSMSTTIHYSLKYIIHQSVHNCNSCSNVHNPPKCTYCLYSSCLYFSPGSPTRWRWHSIPQPSPAEGIIFAMLQPKYWPVISLSNGHNIAPLWSVQRQFHKTHTGGAAVVHEQYFKVFI